MSKRIRVNVRTAVHNDTIRREKREGRDVIVIPSATMPDDIVMNGIRYPAQEIKNSFHTLERSLAPLHHPVDDDDNFVSASDPVALNKNYFGCFNSNVRQEDGRVLLEKVIDVERARESDLGKRVLDAIDAGKPIHTSTGLLANLSDAEDGDEADYIAKDILFDHDAVLLDEPGAATPEQGVGMMLANKARSRTTGDKIDVMNCDLSDARKSEQKMETLLDGIVNRALTVLNRKGKESEKMAENKTPATNDDDMSMADMMKKMRGMMDVENADMDEMKGMMDKIMSMDNGGDNMDSMKSAMKAAMEEMTQKMMPEMLKSAMAEYQTNQKKDELVAKVVANKLLEEDVAKDTPVPALEAMLEKHNPNVAAPIIGNFKVNGKGGKSPFNEMPKD